MTALAIHPGTAFGPLRIGMTEQEAIDAMAALGFEPAPDSGRIWFEQCLMAEFSLPDARLGFVELSDGRIRGEFGGVDVLAGEQAEIVALFQRVTGEAPRIEEDGDSVSFARSGAALWRGGDDERAPGRWETVAVGAPGSFDPA